MDIPDEARGPIAAVASRRMRVMVPIDAQTISAVAQVLRQFRRNLSHDQSLRDAETILKGVNQELLNMPVPTPPAAPVDARAMEGDPLKMDGKPCDCTMELGCREREGLEHPGRCCLEEGA